MGLKTSLLSYRDQPDMKMCLHKVQLLYFLQSIGVAPITNMRNENSNIQGGSPNEVNVIFHTIRNCSFKERIRSLWEQILSFKRNSHFEKGHN